MLRGQMLPGQMSSWQLESAKEGPRNLPLKFGQNRASNSWDMASFPMVNYRDPKKRKEKIYEFGKLSSRLCPKANYRDPKKRKDMNLANSVVDFAASSRSWGSVGKLGLQSNWQELTWPCHAFSCNYLKCFKTDGWKTNRQTGKQSWVLNFNGVKPCKLFYFLLHLY